jgi:copper chaperone CopZ
LPFYNPNRQFIKGLAEMHIITGLIVSSLLGKRLFGARSPRNFTLSFRGIIETRHLLSGRVRYRVPKLINNPQAKSEVEETIAGVEGITEVRANTVTGSVLVTFRQEKIDYRLILAALAKVLELDKAISETPHSRLAEGLDDLGGGLNRAVYEYSGGLVDVKTLLPLGLAGVGLYSLVRSRNLALPGAFTLLWWAYQAMRNGRSAI